MNQEPKQNQARDAETSDRREVVKKLGKFAVYAAPFTVLASTAVAANASGPAKGSSVAPSVRHR